MYTTNISTIYTIFVHIYQSTFTDMNESSHRKDATFACIRWSILSILRWATRDETVYIHRIHSILQRRRRRRRIRSIQCDRIHVHTQIYNARSHTSPAECTTVAVYPYAYAAWWGGTRYNTRLYQSRTRPLAHARRNQASLCSTHNIRQQHAYVCRTLQSVWP